MIWKVLFWFSVILWIVNLILFLKRKINIKICIILFYTSLLINWISSEMLSR
jgi:uncharacterized membrane protein YtjA (UPF0391 family)